MDETRTLVYDQDGLLGWLVADDQPMDGINAVLRLEDGRTVRVPVDQLSQREDGSFYLPVGIEQIAPEIEPSNEEAPAPEASPVEKVIPVIAEEASITKHSVTKSYVQVEKNVNEREETIEVPVIHTDVEVERVPINKVVDTPPEVRYEGDTMIIPVVEERLVVEKRLVLKEEVRVTRARSQEREARTITLREEAVDVRRTEDPAGETNDSKEE